MIVNDTVPRAADAYSAKWVIQYWSDCTVRMVVECLRDYVSQFPYTTVVHCDSAENTNESIPALKQIVAASVQGAACVRTVELLRLHQSLPLFTGFDEIWFSTEIPTLLPTDPEHYLVGPVIELYDYAFAIGRQAGSEQYRLGFGDGAGLTGACALGEFVEFRQALHAAKW